EATADELCSPLHFEAVLSECVEFDAKLVPFLSVGGEAEASGPAQRVAGEQREPVEVPLGETPVLGGALPAQPFARLVVRHGAAAESDAAVAAARALPDAPRVANAHPETGADERQRRRDARDAGADDLDVDLVETHRGQRRSGIVGEPPGRHRADA